ncbi:MAG: hypothetical protein HKP58_16480 [Desulfatitalea sp.]|nr:hypothetical protein [Desulfatitalea sp.]NNK02010.1 hypothetical protein [Desulfatitalea sp.]
MVRFKVSGKSIFSCVAALIYVSLSTCLLNIRTAECFDGSSPVNVEKVAAAQADECFYRLGSSRNYFNPDDLTADEIRACLDSDGTLKRNPGYLWGLTKTEDTLWFGTGSNIMAVGVGGALENFAADRLLSYKYIIPPFRTANIVFELDNSKYMDGEYGFIGDYRPPRIFAYNFKTNQLTDQTPDDALLLKTFGLRSAGFLDGVVILAGPSIDPNMKGINLFAFEAATQRFLGSAHIRDLKDSSGNVIAEKISNIRKWLAVKGVLYTTVGTAGGGKVLRWRGSINNPFHFEVVGDLEDQGTELVYHENRLFVMTWPPSDSPNGFSGEGDINNVCDIMMTQDEIPEGGLTAGAQFVKVWNPRDYEPDDITAATYGLGGAVSYDGYLYWGTMHLPLVAALLHITENPGDYIRPSNIAQVFLNTNRQSVIFRGKNFASGHPEIELVYGDEYLYQYQPDARWLKDKWKRVPNNMNVKPLFGEAGFGIKTVFYIWSMAVHKNQLYVGTLDVGYPDDSDKMMINMLNRIVNGFLGILPTAMDDTIHEILAPPDSVPGANLYRFVDSQSPAVTETDDGFANPGIYGIRNMIAVDDALFVGSASSYSLHPNGGWELYKLTTGD